MATLLLSLLPPPPSLSSFLVGVVSTGLSLGLIHDLLTVEDLGLLQVVLGHRDGGQHGDGQEDACVDIKQLRTYNKIRYRRHNISAVDTIREAIHCPC